MRTKFKIKSSEFRHRIIIKESIEKTNDDNIPVKTLNELFRAKAKIVNAYGEELNLMDGDTVKEKKTFYIRYNKNKKVQEDHYVEYHNKVYNIKSVNNIDEANIYLALKCELPR